MEDCLLLLYKGEREGVIEELREYLRKEKGKSIAKKVVTVKASRIINN